MNPVRRGRVASDRQPDGVCVSALPGALRGSYVGRSTALRPLRAARSLDTHSSVRAVPRTNLRKASNLPADLRFSSKQSNYIVDAAHGLRSIVDPSCRKTTLGGDP